MNSYLDTALARIRTGIIIEFIGNTWHVYDTRWDIYWGGFQNPSEALAHYMLCCSLADLPPSEHLYVPGHIGML